MTFHIQDCHRQHRSITILCFFLPAVSWGFPVHYPSATASRIATTRSPASYHFDNNNNDNSNNQRTTVSRKFSLGATSSKGFGSPPSSNKKSKSTDNNNNISNDESQNLQRIYSAPALYDLAMGYRNYPDEVEFLLDAHKRLSKQKKRPTSVIEVASGPGRHCMEALKTDKGITRVVALDLSQEMVDYGIGVAKEELNEDQLSQFTFLCEDMRSFALDEPCDSAWILAGSLQHMTTNSDVIESFSAIHRALSSDGTLIIELPHPNELFNVVDSTTNSWQVPLEDDGGKEYGQLQVVWGAEDDDIDLIKQVRQNTVVLNLEGVEDAEKNGVRGTVPLKLFTAQEMELFARCSGFEVAAMYGALNEEVSIDDEDTAYRLVCILRKI